MYIRSVECISLVDFADMCQKAFVCLMRLIVLSETLINIWVEHYYYWLCSPPAAECTQATVLTVYFPVQA